MHIEGGTARLARMVAGAGVAAILLLHAGAIWARLYRAPHHDEGEHLHAAWMISQGKRLYRDFNENHSPFLYALLQPAVHVGGSPRLPLLDLPAVLERGRLLSAFASLAAAAAVALLAWRATRDPAAPVVALACALGSGPTWGRAIADVRSEPLTLGLFWVGALLVLWPERQRPLLAGFGAGLVAFAAVWNPKWPLETLVVAVLYLLRLRGAGVPRAVASMAIAAAIPLASLPLAFHYATPADNWFFSVTFTRGFYRWFAQSPAVAQMFGFRDLFQYCPRRFHPPFAIAGLVIANAAVRRPWRGRLISLAAVLIALAAALELRFLYSYPNLWPQYFVMWVFALSLVYALVPAAIGLLLRLTRYRDAISIGAIVIAVTAFAATERSLLSGETPRDAGYWVGVTWLQQNLKPGHSVWLSPSVHPIAAPDASYYWYAFPDQVPFALAWSAGRPGPFLPPITERDLPPCLVAGGRPTSLQFMQGAVVRNLPVARDCFVRALAAGRLRRTPLPDIYEVSGD